jgi:hypothetical protein
MSKPGLRVVATQQDWSGGVDSSRVPQFRSAQNPHGLGRNELSWLESGTVRGGGISSRDGLQPLVQGAKWPGIYQGGSIYEPVNGNPYLMLDIGGRVYQVRVDTDNSVHDVTGAFARSATIDQHWAVQGEEFLIKQDGVAEPLVWNGSVLNKISSMGGAPPYLPTGTAMAYYDGRVFVASGGRQYLIGDIVNGTANGTSNILHAAENAIYPGGGGFIVPTNAGNIRGIAYTSNINQPVSVGTVFIGTRKAIYAFNGSTQRFPPDLINNPGVGGWINTPNLVTVAQFGNGFVNDRSIVGYNGDLFFQTLEPGLRSLALSVRYANQWANVPISNNESRVLALADRSLLRFGSGIEFNNRLLQTTLPFQTSLGVAHKGIMPLDFDIISSLEDRLSNTVFPAWEGMLDMADVLQLFQADFGGLQRAFAVIVSRISNQIEVWEITAGRFRDNGDNRISFYAETGAFDWGNSDYLKELESMDLWYDELFGTAEILVEYRADGGCWNFWHQWRVCTSRNPQESGAAASKYPTQLNCPSFGLQSLPKPPALCQSGVVKRPTNIANQFQFRFTLKGNIRIRGFWAFALLRERSPWENLAC